VPPPKKNKLENFKFPSTYLVVGGDVFSLFRFEFWRRACDLSTDSGVVVLHTNQGRRRPGYVPPTEKTMTGRGDYIVENLLILLLL